MFPETKVSSAFIYEAVIDEAVSLDSLVLDVSLDSLGQFCLANECKHVRDNLVVPALRLTLREV